LDKHVGNACTTRIAYRSIIEETFLF